MSAPSPLARGRRLMPALALVCIGLQFPGRLLPTTGALVIWLAALAAFDRDTLRRLWMPRFLTLTVLVALAAGMLLGKSDARLWGLPFSRSGLEAGALMTVRGLFIFGLTSWASRALMRDELRGLRRLLRHERLATAMASAVQLIPGLTGQLRRSWSEQRQRGRLSPLRLQSALVSLVEAAARIAEAQLVDPEPAIRAAPRARRVAVSGPQGSGKTTTLLALAERLRGGGFEVGGVRQPVRYEGGLRAGYDLEALSGGERRPLARARTRDGGRAEGFDFDPDAWGWAAERIRAARRDHDVLVLDELGRLEARGEGHLPALAEPLEAERCGLWLLGVRADAVDRLAERAGPFELVFAPSDDPAVLDGYARQLHEVLGERRQAA